MTGLERFLELSDLYNAHHDRLWQAARKPTTDGSVRYGAPQKIPFPHIEEFRAEGLAHQDELRQALASPSQTLSVLFAITHTDEPRLGELAIDATRDHPDPDVRSARLQAACHTRATRCWRAFLEGLDDPEERVRLACANFVQVLVRCHHRALLRDALLRVASNRAEATAVRLMAIDSASQFAGRVVDHTLRAIAAEEEAMAPFVAVALRKSAAARYRRGRLRSGQAPPRR
ncbi:MAG: hypothetical protein ABMA64_02030 [Myxococcota bacterium]